MDMFSKKPSTQDTVTKDTSDTIPSEPVTTATTPTQPLVTKEKHSKAFSFVSVLFILMILAVGVMTYLWYNQKADYDSLQNEITASEATITGLRTQLGKLNKENTTLEDTVVDQATGANAASDDDQIKKAVVVYNHAYVAAEKTQYTVNVTKKEGAFAWASFGTVPPEGGAKCLLKKVDSVWVILYCGQDTMSQSELDKWGVPKGF